MKSCPVGGSQSGISQEGVSCGISRRLGRPSNLSSANGRGRRGMSHRMLELMPMASKKPCSAHGCCQYVVNSGFCTQHAPQRWGFRGSASARGYDRPWRELSERKRAVNPVCEHCHAAPADCVDHIVPIRVRPSSRMSWGNLQSLCQRCHDLKTASDRSLYSRA